MARLLRRPDPSGCCRINTRVGCKFRRHNIIVAPFLHLRHDRYRAEWSKPALQMSCRDWHSIQPAAERVGGNGKAQRAAVGAELTGRVERLPPWSCGSSAPQEALFEECFDVVRAIAHIVVRARPFDGVSEQESSSR